MKGKVWVRFAAAFAVAIALAAVASAQSRTRTVAKPGAGAPGGGVFTPSVDRINEKGLPSIVGNSIVFGSDVLLNGQTVYGVFLESGGALRLLTRVGLPAPGGGTVQDISFFTVDRIGNAFVLARTGSGTGPDVLLSYSFGATRRVISVGGTIPGGFTVTSLGLAAAGDGIGGVFFQAGYSTSPGSNDSALVHARSDGTMATVAATGLPAPGGGTYGAISPISITSSTSGLVGFAATVEGGTGGIFTGIPGNILRAADASDALPNLVVADNDDVDVAFQRPGVSGILLATISGTQTFVPNNTAAPRTATGRINFAAFNVALGADREGSVYFFAPIAGQDQVGAGLFSRDRITGEMKAVVLQRDPAAGDVSGVFGFFALIANRPTHLVNDDGKVVFTATAGTDTSFASIFTTLGAPQGLVPSIANVQIKGNKLIVTGSSFEPGAKIVVNGTTLADTKNNKKNPTTKLQSKSGPSTVPAGSTVSITVQNPSGAVSAPFSFRR